MVDVGCDSPATAVGAVLESSFDARVARRRSTITPTLPSTTAPIMPMTIPATAPEPSAGLAAVVAAVTPASGFVVPEGDSAVAVT